METITWKSQTERFTQMLNDLTMTGNFADVTLVLDDQSQIKSHKVILAAVSQFFRDILDDADVQEDLTIHLSEVQYDELESLLLLIYCGDIETIENSERIQDLCNQYQIIGSKLAINNNSVGEYFEEEEIEPEIKNESGSLTTTEESFDSEEEIRKTEVESTPMKCMKCNKIFSSKYSLKVHIETVHEGIRNFGCEYCEKKFKAKGVLAYHIRNIHHTKEEKATPRRKKYNCNECERQFFNNMSLKYHIKAIHKNIESYDCSLCNRKFSKSKGLKRHFRDIHMDHKYKCNQCDKEFNDGSNLRIHKDAVHEIKFKCNLCEKAFAAKRNLKLHIESIHKGVKYPCIECDKQFTHPTHLSVHVKSKHEKGYSCPDCGIVFSASYTLKKHHCGTRWT